MKYIKILTFSAENKAKSLRVRLLLLGGTAGGGGLTWSRFILPSRDLIDTPLGGKAGGPDFGCNPPCLPLERGSFLEGGAGVLFPFILCGSIGEFVANWEAVTALVFKVPVLFEVMLPLEPGP